MRQRAFTRLLPVATLLILSACAQPASTGIPTPNVSAQQTAQAEQALAAAAAAAATATQAALDSAVPTPIPPPPLELTPTSETPPVQAPTATLPPPEIAPTPTPRPPSTTTSATRPRPSSTTCGRRIVHVVRAGENLFRIALRYRTTINAIARLNGITNTRLIRTGQRLVVITCRRGAADPVRATTGVVHVVRPGETLTRIALRYGTSVEHLMAINHMHSTLIVSGQTLIIA